MTPPARIAAAAGILDQVLAGRPAEQALTNWGRQSRYAGSKDRAAVRDLVFDGLRRKRSAAAAGGAKTGRGLMLGLIRLAGDDPSALMTGKKHALPPPSPDETPRSDPWPDAVKADMPDWLWPQIATDLGDHAPAVLDALQARAPLFLRANPAKTDRSKLQGVLAKDGVETAPHPTIPTALIVTEGNAACASQRPI